MYSEIGLILLIACQERDPSEYANHFASKMARRAELSSRRRIRLRPIHDPLLDRRFFRSARHRRGRRERKPLGGRGIGGTVGSRRATLVLVPVVYTYLSGGSERMLSGGPAVEERRSRNSDSRQCPRFFPL